MIDLDVPFFANTPDDSHCFQAALRIILAYYIPGRIYSWEELDVVSGRNGLPYTWSLAGTLYCVSLGFHALSIEGFDYRRFSIEGDAYIRATYGAEVADDQQRNSNIPQEMENAVRFIDSVQVQTRIPTRFDLQQSLEQGRPVICNVNSRVLAGRAGYAGHFVVVKGFDERGVRLHDPGLPPLQDRFVDWAQFDQAWAYPNEHARNLTVLWLPKGALVQQQ